MSMRCLRAAAGAAGLEPEASSPPLCVARVWGGASPRPQLRLTVATAWARPRRARRPELRGIADQPRANHSQSQKSKVPAPPRRAAPHGHSQSTQHRVVDSPRCCSFLVSRAALSRLAGHRLCAAALSPQPRSLPGPATPSSSFFLQSAAGPCSPPLLLSKPVDGLLDGRPARGRGRPAARGGRARRRAGAAVAWPRARALAADAHPVADEVRPAARGHAEGSATLCCCARLCGARRAARRAALRRSPPAVAPAIGACPMPPAGGRRARRRCARRRALNRPRANFACTPTRLSHPRHTHAGSPRPASRPPRTARSRWR